MTRQFYRILIAEDNAVNLKLITRILTKLNHIPETASNGLEVLQLLQYKRFDFILMDIQMPKMDGLETTRQIIATLEPSIRPIIIAMTANAMKGDREKCLEAGMDDYLSKPIIIAELEKKLMDCMKLRKGKPVITEDHLPDTNQPDNPINMVDMERLVLLRTHQPLNNALLDLFQIFFTECQELIKKMQLERIAGDIDGMQESAHSLKGACLNYGAIQIAELCGRLEQQLHNKEWQDLPDTLSQFKTSLELTTQQITKWIYAQA